MPSELQDMDGNERMNQARDALIRESQAQVELTPEQR